MPRNSNPHWAKSLLAAPPPGSKDKWLDLIRTSQSLIELSHELIEKASVIRKRVRQLSERERDTPARLRVQNTTSEESDR
jgi:hypothetical protein